MPSCVASRAAVFADGKIAAAERRADDEASRRMDRFATRTLAPRLVDRVEQVLDGLSAAGVDRVGLAAVVNLQAGCQVERRGGLQVAEPASSDGWPDSGRRRRPDRRRRPAAA